MSADIPQRTHDSLDRVDAMPRPLKECVYDYGLPIVEVLVKHGVKNPAHIREIVREIWNGARSGVQRQHSNPLGSADWLLTQSVGQISIRALMRTLSDNNMVIVPVSPTRAMLAASMAEVSTFDIKCTKEEKHRRRLRAASRAAMEEFMK